MKKSIRRNLTLAVLLTVGLTTWVTAKEEPQLLMDSGHNAVVRFKESEKSNGIDGSFDVAADLAKGLSTIKTDLKFGPDQQKQMGDGSGSFYVTLGPSFELVGSLDVPLPADAKKNSPKKGDAEIESVFSDSNSYAKGSLSLVSPVPNAVPKISIDGKGEGTSKTLNGTTNYSFDLGAEKAKNIPFKTFELDVSEKENLTTLKFSIAVDQKSQYAEQIKSVAKKPDDLQNGVKSTLGAYVQVDKVEFSDFKDTPDVSASLTIVLKDWRAKVASQITDYTAAAGAKQKMDGEKLKTGVNRCMEIKISKFDFKVGLEGTVIKGSLDAALDNVNSFMIGYYDVLGVVMDAKLNDKDETQDFTKKLTLAYQSVSFEEAQKALKALSESDLKFKGDYNLVLEAPADKDGKVGDLKVDGGFNVKFDNFKSYVDKMTAAGLPFGKSSAAKLVAKITDSGRVQASIYASNDAKVFDYYKQLLMRTLTKAGAPEDQVKLVETVTINGGQMAFSASSAGVTGSGFTETSSLVPVAKAIGAAADKRFSADPTGFTFSGKTDKDALNLEGAIYFEKLLEGKSPAEVKDVMAMPVKDAKPEEVKMVAVSKPEVKMPTNLVATEEDGKKLLGGGVAANIPGVAALNAKTGGNGLLILGGLLAAIVVGAGIAAGRKKS